MYLIDKKKYFDWINSNKFLTGCQKKVMIYLRKQLEKIYVNRQSNKQFYTYIENAYKSEKILIIAKIILLLQKFIGYKKAVNLVSEIKKNKMTDTEVLKIMEKTISEKGIKRNSNDVYNLCSSYKYVFESLALKYKDYIKENNIDIKKIIYLDIGCGNGNKTLMFSKSIGIEKENVNGTDIKSWGPYDTALHSSHQFNFKYVKEDGTLDYPDNSFDIITCFLMLHHVEKLDFLLGEINRVLKPSGRVIIIEHDCHDDYDKMILEILHKCFEYLKDKNNDDVSNSGYSSYHNWAEWDFIFDKNNFTYVKSNYIFINLEHSTRFDNIYYAIYAKK